MKVIHLISGGDSGGAKTHVLSLLQHLNQTITAQLVCFRGRSLCRGGPADGQSPTMICGGNNILRIRRRLTAYIREGGFELIHCHGFPGQHDRGHAPLSHRAAGGHHRPQRLPAGLHGPTPEPPDLRHHQPPLALRKLDYRIGVSDAMVDLLISRGFPRGPVLHHLQRHRLHPHRRPRGTGWNTSAAWGPMWTRSPWWWASPPG